MAAEIIPFVSRKQLLIRRGIQSYGRFKSVSIGFTPTNGAVHRQWQAERRENARQDALWALRHGPVEGGARVFDLVRATPAAADRTNTREQRLQG